MGGPLRPPSPAPAQPASTGARGRLSGAGDGLWRASPEHATQVDRYGTAARNGNREEARVQTARDSFPRHAPRPRMAWTHLHRRGDRTGLSLYGRTLSLALGGGAEHHRSALVRTALL